MLFCRLTFTSASFAFALRQKVLPEPALPYVTWTKMLYHYYRWFSLCSFVWINDSAELSFNCAVSYSTVLWYGISFVFYVQIRIRFWCLRDPIFPVALSLSSSFGCPFRAETLYAKLPVLMRTFTHNQTQQFFTLPIKLEPPVYFESWSKLKSYIKSTVLLFDDGLWVDNDIGLFNQFSRISAHFF